MRMYFMTGSLGDGIELGDDFFGLKELGLGNLSNPGMLIHRHSLPLTLKSNRLLTEYSQRLEEQNGKLVDDDGLPQKQRNHRPKVPPTREKDAAALVEKENAKRIKMEEKAREKQERKSKNKQKKEKGSLLKQLKRKQKKQLKRKRQRKRSPTASKVNRVSTAIGSQARGGATSSSSTITGSSSAGSKKNLDQIDDRDSEDVPLAVRKKTRTKEAAASSNARGNGRSNSRPPM
ncbi:unnamed protein product [Rhizophagus irregularis]|nr:unnamed protein product [Rhizophagus irregularis]